jgi:hypothetical protein
VLGKTLEVVSSKEARDTDTAAWIHESFELAREKVYRDPIGIEDQLYTIVPRSTYETEAYKLALKQVALAGARLAQVLNDELK